MKVFTFKFIILFFVCNGISIQAKNHVTKTTTAVDFKVLIFHKTNGFRHTDAIISGIQMITDLGVSNGWTTDNTQNSTDFNATNLAQYKVVIWANTSGDNLLSTSERAAFEAFIRNGGGFIGIHAATDTYRNGSWSWYNDLVGAIVQTSPNHTSNNFPGIMDVLDTNNIIVNHLGNTWSKNEEWYYWRLNGGYLYSGNINLLQVRSTGNNSYDEARPATWYKQYDGGRSFYTALGHNGSDYVANSNFGQMIGKAIVWASNTTLGMGEFDNSNSNFLMYPNPASTETVICNIPENAEIKVFDLMGKIVLRNKYLASEKVRLDLSGLYTGIYIINITNDAITKSQKLVLQR
ncbi:ThuA domain-containing protein [Flavobacterium sp.]|uniref:ThuA domain-containing protein n=1 Tax=Flavobacterium sp. TaxID=239 RepID=UPI00286E667D|nr:ThuA domain-containing protein [Flavobacterium sp.]